MILLDVLAAAAAGSPSGGLDSDFAVALDRHSSCVGGDDAAHPFPTWNARASPIVSEHNRPEQEP